MLKLQLKRPQDGNEEENKRQQTTMIKHSASGKQKRDKSQIERHTKQKKEKQKNKK